MNTTSRSKLYMTLLGSLALTAVPFTARADDVTYMNDSNGRTKTVTGAGWSIVYDYDANGNAIQITRTTPIALLGVVSRKVQGAEKYDLPLNRFVPINGAVTVEPRHIGSGHVIVFQFNSPITNPGAINVGRAGTLVGNLLSLTASGNEVRATVANIPDGKRATAMLTGVNGGTDIYSVSIGFLRGDVNNTRAVNASDISGVKTILGRATSWGNFTRNINAATDISADDVSSVKLQSGRVLEP